jgi:hypothetical protein
MLGRRQGVSGLPDHSTARELHRATILELQRSIGNHHVQRLLQSRPGFTVIQCCGAKPCARPGEERVSHSSSIQREWWDNDEEETASWGSESSVTDWVEEQAGAASDWASEQASEAVDWGAEQAGGAAEWVDEQTDAASQWFQDNGVAGTEALGSAWTEGGASSIEPGSAWTEGKESEDPSALVSPEDYAIIQGAIQNALTIHGPGASQPVLLAAAIAAVPAIPVAIVIAVALAIIAILVSATDTGPPRSQNLGKPRSLRPQFAKRLPSQRESPLLRLPWSSSRSFKRMWQRLPQRSRSCFRMREIKS